MSSAAGAQHAFSTTQLPMEHISNIPLVHRILLADPSEYSHLTLSTAADTGGNCTTTTTFEEFEAFMNDRRDPQVQTELNYGEVMKIAFLDQVCEKMKLNKSIKPAGNLLVELHRELRALIPSRKDLHELLNDNAVESAQSREDLLILCLKAAQALSLLESEARAESTLAWISLAQRDESLLRDGDSADRFLATSLLYLLFKSKLCAQDKEKFYFANIWVPELARIGPAIARADFEKQYGPMSNPSAAPATKQWLQSIDRSGESSIAFHQQIIRAWVHDIVFRSRGAGNIPLPEIFYLDTVLLGNIRMAVRMAVAGSALGIHACQTAGQPTDVLLEENIIDPTSQLDLRRAMLEQAMGERFKDEGTYLDDITESVVELARCWQPNLEASKEESLRSRTSRVLAANDPVVELLEGRMKACFAELLSSFPSTIFIPKEMRSGTSHPSMRNGSSSSRKITFLLHATNLFRSKGLSLFVSDLAVAAWKALRVIEVAILLYSDTLLEPSMQTR